MIVVFNNSIIWGYEGIVPYGSSDYRPSLVINPFAKAVFYAKHPELFFNVVCIRPAAYGIGA